jgi:hypothetical protein
LKPKSRSKIAKQISQQQPSLQSSKTSKTTPTGEEEDDEDGSFNSKRRKESQQKIRKDESKKKKPSNILEDFDDEDGTLSKPKDKIKKPKSKKKPMFVQCFQHQDDNDSVPVQKKLNKNRVLSTEEDEDGGPIVKTYNNIKKIILFKQPILKSPNTNDESSSDTISYNTTQSSTPLTHEDLTLVDQEVPEISADNPKIKPNDSDPVPTEEKHDIQPTTTTKSRKSFTAKSHFLRRKSYEEAQQNSPSIISQRSDNSISLCDQNNTNDDHETHYSKIINEKIRTIINNLLSAISHSTSQQTYVDKQLKQRKKRAQIRWYLAYTIIRNPSLHALRKQYLKQLQQQPMAITTNVTSETLRTRRMK